MCKDNVNIYWNRSNVENQSRTNERVIHENDMWRFQATPYIILCEQIPVSEKSEKKWSNFLVLVTMNKNCLLIHAYKHVTQE